MILFQKIPMSFEEKDYEIRVLYDDRTINVVAFLNNRPANGCRYQVQIPRQCDVKKILQKRAVPELVETCKKDIIEKRWEALAKIISESRESGE